MFNVIQCPKCGKIQATQSMKSLKCKYCHKGTIIVGAKGINLKVLKRVCDGREAAMWVRAYNEQKVI